MLPRLIFIAKFITLPLLFLSCKSKVETIKPSIQSITESVYASGVIKTQGQYQVFANTRGIIGKLLVKEGDVLQKGQTIAVLSNEALSASTESSRITAEYNAVENNRQRIKEAEQNVELAKQKADNDALLVSRQRNLWQQGIGTKVELDTRELAAKNSSTVYKNALLQLQELKKQLNFSAAQSKANARAVNAQANDLNVRSSVNGQVFTILKEQGEMVTPQTPIAVVGNNRSFYLELQVDEYDIAKILIGQKVLVTMDSYKGKVFEATVTRIIPFMNERSKTFTIEAVFDTPPETLYPNLTLEANIVTNKKDKALLIPREYLLDDNYVQLENDEKRKVTTGAKDYQQVEIISGITANDIIKKPGK